MKRRPLVIYSSNGKLAQIVKSILEETGDYKIKVESALTEDSGTRSNDVEFIEIDEVEKLCFPKTLPMKDLIYFGEFVFNANFRKLQWKDQQSFILSLKESEILHLLLENAGNIVTRNFILESYWGEVSFYKSRSLDVTISKLRKLLSLDPSISIINYRQGGLVLVFE